MPRQVVIFSLVLCVFLSACRCHVHAYHPYQKIKARSPALVTPALPHKAAIIRSAIYRDLQKQQVTLLHKQHTVLMIMPSTANFSPNSAVVNENFYAILDNVIKFLQRYPYADADMLGYTDNQGSAAQNRQIALARANAVIHYLVSQGIPKSRLTPVARGTVDPRGNNNTLQGRFLNRRVEIFIY